eukprot:3277446-Pleurochrysis_carterae.AAC.7
MSDHYIQLAARVIACRTGAAEACPSTNSRSAHALRSFGEASSDGEVNAQLCEGRVSAQSSLVTPPGGPQRGETASTRVVAHFGSFIRWRTPCVAHTAYRFHVYLMRS